MNGLTPEQIAHEMAFAKFLKGLLIDYKDHDLSDGQLYRLYQLSFNEVDLAEIVRTGAAEELP